MVIYFFSMYPAIILPIVAVCGFEFPIILAPTIEGEAEAVKITKEKRREEKTEGEMGTQIRHKAIHARLPQL